MLPARSELQRHRGVGGTVQLAPHPDFSACGNDMTATSPRAMPLAQSAGTRVLLAARSGDETALRRLLEVLAHMSNTKGYSSTYLAMGFASVRRVPNNAAP